MKLLPILFIELTEAGAIVVWIIIGTATLLTALGVIYKFFKPIIVTCDTKWFKPLRDSVEKQKTIDEALQRIEGRQDQTQETVDAIKAEVKTNGGGSLKDSVLRVERRLEHTSSKLHFREQTMPQAVFEMDAHMNWVSANRALCEMLNVESTELLNRGWITCLEPGIRQKVLGEWKDAIENKIIINSRWTVIDREHDEPFIVRIHAEPYTDRDNQLLGFFGYVQIAK